MSSIPRKPPLADDPVARGAKSQTEKPHSSVAVVHRSGTQSPAEHAAVGTGGPVVRRPGHKLPIPPTGERR